MKIQRSCKTCKKVFIATKINHFYCCRNCFKKAYYIRTKIIVMPIIKKLRKLADDDFFTPKEISLALNQNNICMVMTYIKSGMLKRIDEKTTIEINKTNRTSFSQKHYISGKDFNDFLVKYVDELDEKMLVKSDIVKSKKRRLLSVTEEDIKNEKYYQEMLKEREDRLVHMRKYRKNRKNVERISEIYGVKEKEKAINKEKVISKEKAINKDNHENSLLKWLSAPWKSRKKRKNKV